MIDYDTTTMTEGNILRRYREINLCSDDRASMAALHLLVAEPMISKVTKRTSWLDFFRLLSRWCWISSRLILASKKLFLREKRTEKARCICHTRHSTCSHVDLVVLGVSQHSSLSVLFSVAPPNKCRFGDGKRRVTQFLIPENTYLVRMYVYI